MERKPPYTARIYAAGFDQHTHIFLGVSTVYTYVHWAAGGGMAGVGFLQRQPLALQQIILLLDDSCVYRIAVSSN